MPKYDATRAECRVFSYKDGPLARAAHDLEMRVKRFSIEHGDDRDWVRAEFDATSVDVVTAMTDKHAEEVLSESDLAKIRAHIHEDVLLSVNFPQITFESSAVLPQNDGYRITGALSIRGTQRNVTYDVKGDGDRWRVDALVHQPDFGIKPFRALMGAIRIKPGVRVTVSIPREAPPS
ncbi:MAG: YceI family protein [Myxococcota bacterium]